VGRKRLAVNGGIHEARYMRRYAPAFLDGCEAVKAMKEIKYARVRDFIGFNSLFVNPTSRVIRDEQLPESVKNDISCAMRH
jgi:hypothetical protein